jgi:hypothetical protein
MVNVELSGQAANDVSGRFIRSAGLSSLSRSSNQINQIDQLPATHRELAPGTFLFSGPYLPALLID